MLTDKALPRSFYSRHVVEVARNLIGKTLVFDGMRGVITETEAYRGVDDLASHAAKGVAPRSKIMFGVPGYTYVYMIYGIHYCLNIVAEEDGQAVAVLIRSLDLDHLHLNGPGKLTKYLGITKQNAGIDVVNNPSFYISEGIALPYVTTSRIGITKSHGDFIMTKKSNEHYFIL